ncbi:MAG TPA: alpha/beta fold hydrolase, partial [Thermoanaerobaculia bacterium]|nr:alpha/beta fold hydrolase [Thermoanaerobaculia bacterium]
FFAGEPLSDLLVGRWRGELAPGTAVVNLYGPTETTLAKCFYVVPAAPAPGIQPVGSALPSAQALVLAGGGQHGRQCAVGEAGEIVIRTPFRSLGYLAAAAEDHNRFRPNPFRDDADDLLYFTGDRGRYRADGILEILGRLDDQVKIRGMRVEPGEVRAVLLRLPGVRDGAVVAREDVPGELRLVAYVVAAHSTEFDVAAAREALRRALPDYMVPAAILVLPALPLTPNGKLDRRALPAPEGTRADHLGRYVAPRDRTELELVALWEELLGVRPIGIRDDFFAIGGHSLLAMRLVARVQERFGRSVPLAALLGAGTVEELARLVRQGDGAAFSSPLVALRGSGPALRGSGPALSASGVALSALGTRPPFFCVHPGGGGVLCYRELAEELGPEQPFYGFQARGLDGEDVPEGLEIADLARRYVTALQSFQPHGPYLLGGWSFGGLVAFEMARQLQEAGESVARLVLLDTPAPGVRQQPDEVTEIATLAAEAGIPVEEAELRPLSPTEQFERLAALAMAAGALPAEVGTEPLRRLLAVFRAHHHASRRYLPSAPDAPDTPDTPGLYPGPVTLLRASERLNEEFPGLTSGSPDYGWGRFCAAPPTVLAAPGNHLTMVRTPHVEALAALLKQAFDGEV